MSLDPFIEIIFEEDPPAVALERYQLPLFFLLGGVDDPYLSQLMGISSSDLHQVIRDSSTDPFPEDALIGVFASRALLGQNRTHPEKMAWARTFPVSVFLNSSWPVLRDLYDRRSTAVDIPTELDRTWIIRAFRRNNLNDWAEVIRAEMLRRIYPKKIPLSVQSKLPREISRENIARIETHLSLTQRNYPAVIIVDDLPIKLAQTIGDIFTSISATGCTQANLATIETSLNLLELS